MLFQTWMTFSLLWNNKEDILMKSVFVNGNENFLDANILQNIFFYVKRKKRNPRKK